MTDARTTTPERLMLLDTAGMYFRAFHGVPDTVRSPDGLPVNAVRGTLDAIARLVTAYRPSHLIACWDDDWRPQWRVDLIPSYKAHRVIEVVEIGPDVEAVPDLLTPQVPVIIDVLAAFGIPIVGAPEHEADDVIGTLASTADMPVDVVTGDRDLIQLVDDSRQIRVIYTGRGMSNLEELTDAAVHAKYGIQPSQYADFATLRGDPSDGLPGVAGIGEKSAATLLGAYGDLDGLARAAKDPSSALTNAQRTKIVAAEDYLRVAPRVVQVVRDLELPGADASIADFDETRRAAITALADRWGLGDSARRAVDALSALTRADSA